MSASPATSTRVQRLTQQAILAAALAGEVVVFSALGTNFLTVENAFEVVRLVVEIGLLALALTPVIVTGGIDLSVGSLMGLSAVLLGAMWRDLGLPVWLAAVATVDVRIPVLGRSSYVGGAIESVLGQSFPDWSLVVSENGMPDPDVATALLPYLSDTRVRHVRVGAEISAAAHHSRLVQTGEAPYVAVLHDDDRWHPGVLRDRVAALEREFAPHD